MKKKILVLIGAVLMLTVAACGNNATEKKNNDNKIEETVQNELNNEDKKPEDDAQNSETEEPKEDLQVEETKAQEDDVQPEEKPAEPTVTKVTMYAKSNVNVRSGANASHSKIGNLVKGQEVVKVGEENGWSKIEFNGAVGYVSSKYLSSEKINTNVNNHGNNSNTNAGNTSPNVPTPSTPTPSTPTHEHNWIHEHKNYEIIENYVNGCNGCGYPLFTIGESGASHIENLYFHPPCYTDRFEGDCTGGGFHNESFTSGYCYSCGGKVSYRQCMWTEMGKRCCKNETLGTYEKVVFDGNFLMYFDVCDCGANIIACDDNGGAILVRKVCGICGLVEE